MTVWVDGELRDPAEAVVGAFDHGLLVGDGVFETMLAYGGRAFAVRRHLERLARSAAVLGIAVPPVEQIRSGVEAVLKGGGARVRVTLTGGDGVPGSEKGTGAPRLIVTATEFSGWPETADVVVVPWVRNERGALAGVKATSYGENVVALEYARRRGGSEAIFGNTQGHLCEGTGSNVFVVWEGRLITPPLDSGCLAGVTRELVIELAREGGIEVFEENLKLRDLVEADEVFLTSTTRELQPVARVDGKLVANGAGEVSGRLRSAFKGLIERSIDP